MAMAVRKSVWSDVSLVEQTALYLAPKFEDPQTHEIGSRASNTYLMSSMFLPIFCWMRLIVLLFGTFHCAQPRLGSF